jgi:photosystem II stability/assembly factor-like uncharacterized protein
MILIKQITTKYTPVIVLSLTTFLISFIWLSGSETVSVRLKQPKLSDTGRALNWWFESRVFPGDDLHNQKFLSEYVEFTGALSKQSAVFPGNWEALGPKNFGGRTLCLAFNPQNNATLFAGTASGGLWKSYSAGVGAQAWEEISTGFPVLGVGAIAINPNDSNEIYIGTGEVYNYQNTGTGFAVRTTRGTYGIGILKSTDGGITWNPSLNWNYDDLTGVQDLLINPDNPQTVFAATTEGTYRTTDSGAHWSLVHNVIMAIDLEYTPGDTSVIFVSCGNSGSANHGIYKSVDGGATFQNSSTGIPTGLTGKILFDIADASPNIMLASVANQLAGMGLYRSSDSGNSWSQINSTDFQLYQGWYSHDVVIDPMNPQNVLCCGINVWKSIDGGSSITQNSLWSLWDFNAVTPGGSEGPPDYVHADIHAMLYHPQTPGVVYFATDGGVFRSVDNGLNFEGVNGGFQCQQFYANIACSMSDSLFVIGGMQDNATAIYEGNPGWRRVIGGDGLSAAVDPFNDQTVFASYQYLNVRKSTNKAISFSNAQVPSGGTTCFAGPYEISRSNSSVLYAGRTEVFKSVDQGSNWTTTNQGAVLDGNPVLTIEISATDPNKVYVATAPVNNPNPAIFKTTNGGSTWVNVTGALPQRYIMDVVVNPADDDTVFAVISGFGTPHLYRSVNAGNVWMPIGTGLPDVPSNSLFVDPLNTNVMYLGNDIGIYVSIDAGLTWTPFSDGLVDATLVMNITYSASNRKLRIGTHGNGIYQRDMLPVTVTGINNVVGKDNLIVFPNPAGDYIEINLPSDFIDAQVTLWDLRGRLAGNLGTVEDGKRYDLSEYKNGSYLLKVEHRGETVHSKLLIQR